MKTVKLLLTEQEVEKEKEKILGISLVAVIAIMQEIKKGIETPDRVIKAMKTLQEYNNDKNN